MTTTTTATKTCTRCARTLPLTAYSPGQGKCRTCRAEIERQTRAADRPRSQHGRCDVCLKEPARYRAVMPDGSAAWVCWGCERDVVADRRRVEGK